MSAAEPGVSASGRVGGGSSSADQFESSREVAGSGGNRTRGSEELKSIEEVAQWLDTVPDRTVDAELAKMHEAVLVLREESPKKKQIRPLCGAWKQAVKRNQKCLPLAVVTAELREKLVAASNQVKQRLEQMTVSSASGAEQPARDTGVALEESPSKRLRAAEPERSKRELESALESDTQEKKQKHLTAFFEMRSSAKPMSIDMGAEEKETCAPGAEPRRKQRDMLQLSRELQKYRTEDAGAIDMEEEIKQSARLRNWPPSQRMVREPEIRCLYGESLGSLGAQ